MYNFFFLEIDYRYGFADQHHVCHDVGILKYLRTSAWYITINHALYRTKIYITWIFGLAPPAPFLFVFILFPSVFRLSTLFISHLFPYYSIFPPLIPFSSISSSSLPFYSIIPFNFLSCISCWQQNFFSWLILISEEMLP